MPGRIGSWRVVTWAVLAAASSLITARGASAQSLEISDGSAARVESLAVRADVEEGVASVEVDQRFRNPTNRVLEGVWTIRLPEGAVVRSLSMWMNGREKHGEVLESDHARRIYDEIVRAQADPALLEEVGFRTFKVSVFPIPARDSVRVRLRYAYLVPDDLGVHDLALPLPTNAAEVAALEVDVRVRSASGVSALGATAPAGARAEPQVTVDRRSGRVRWSAERTRVAGPFRVTWTPAADGWSVSVLAHKPLASDGAFLIRAVPRRAAAAELPRDIVLVADTSGSMSGVKIEQARSALSSVLGSLRDVDRFGLVTFSTAAALRTGPLLVPATPDEVTRARGIAATLEATGGTNLADALSEARRLLGPAVPGRLAMVVCLTDGDPTVGETSPDRIVAAWSGASQPHVRFFALGIGRDVRDFLLSRLAGAGRGACEYVDRDEDLALSLETLTERLRTPLLVDPEIEVRGVAVRSVEPRPIPDLFRGGALVFAGRYETGGKAEIVLRGLSGRERIEVPITVELPTSADRPHVAQIWARMRIDRLVEDIRVYGMRAELRDEIVRLGVEHQIVSPYTSFLVVEDGIRIPDARESVRLPEPPPPGPTTGGGGGGGPPPPGGGGGAGPTTGGSGSKGGGSSRDAASRSAPATLGGARPDPSRVPPDTREPSDPPAPPEGGGGGTPPGNAGRRQPEQKQRSRSGYEDWSWWWEHERELRVLRSMPSRGPRIDRAVVERDVVPALRNIVLHPRDSDDATCAAAMQALARIDGSSESMRALVLAVLDGMPMAGRRLRTAAVLAPAWMKATTPEIRSRLLAALDEPTLRGAAAFTLGVVARDLEGTERTRVRVALVVALRKADEHSVAPLLGALAALGDRDALPEILAFLGDEGKPSSAARAARAASFLCGAGPSGAGAPSSDDVARALCGHVGDEPGPARAICAALPRVFESCGPKARADIVAHLGNRVAHVQDVSIRAEAMLALGRIAGSPSCSGDTAMTCIQTIYAATPRSSAPSTLTEYACTALALAVRGPESEYASDGLRFERAGGGVPMLLDAALAVVAGTESDRARVASWSADSGLPDEVRGRSALAAALLGVRAAGPPDPRAPQVALRDLADAAAIAGEPADPLPWLARIPAARSFLERSDAVACARVVAECGGPGAAPELLRIVRSESESDFSRALAVRSLGAMASDSGEPFAVYFEDDVRRDHSHAMAELAWFVFRRE